MKKLFKSLKKVGDDKDQPMHFVKLFPS